MSADISVNAQPRFELLRDSPVFGGIREDALTFLLGLSHIVSVRKGQFFFREGDEGCSMFILETGKVAVFKQMGGDDHLLAQLEKGDCFGEMALIDHCPRSASVEAVQNCTAIELSTSTLHEFYQKDVEQFTIIYMNMGREVSRRLRVADQRLFQTEVGNVGSTTKLR